MDISTLSASEKVALGKLLVGRKQTQILQVPANPDTKLAHIAAVYTPPVRGIKGIKRVTMKHRRMVAMHIQGKPHADIARVLGCSPATVSVVLNNPTIRAVLSRIHEEYSKYIQDLKPLVYDALRDSLVNGSRGDKMRAIDRWGRITGEYKDTPQEQQSAEDVIQRMLSIRHTGADGSTTEVRYGEQARV